jgi:Cu(I)/Ag(I) efflux system membrane protein CusA/SilA
VLVTGAAGAQVPLGQVAEIRQVSGPSMIASENGLLVVAVLLNVRGRDVGSFVDEARRVVADTVPLPKGSYIEWSGQHENEARARERLRIVVPVVLLVIFMLLYMTYGSFLEAAHVLLAVPFGLSGRHLSPLRPRLQLLGGRLGGLHRALRHGRPDRRRDGDSTWRRRCSGSARSRAGG